jgi:hypothetical protein
MAAFKANCALVPLSIPQDCIQSQAGIFTPNAWHQPRIKERSKEYYPKKHIYSLLYFAGQGDAGDK